MCGICLVLEGAGEITRGQSCGLARPCDDVLSSTELASVVDATRRRGPDQQDSTFAAFGQCSMTLHGAVLHLRGATISKQPYGSGRPSTLLWNGEAFGSTTISIDEGGNDTEAVYRSIVDAELQSTSVDEFIIRVRSILEGIAGPFAMIFTSNRWKVIVYSRDPLGRRSLVTHLSRSGQIIISSVGTAGHCKVQGVVASGAGRKAPRNHLDQDDGEVDEAEAEEEMQCWSEVPIAGVYSIAIGENGCQAAVTPWRSLHNFHPIFSVAETGKPRTAPYSNCERETRCATAADAALQQYLSAINYVPVEGVDSTFASMYLSALSRAVRRRVHIESRAEHVSDPITVLFSGGIDSVVLALLTHIHSDARTPIELVNVAFGDYPHQTPDRLACANAFGEILSLPQARSREWRLLFVDVTQAEVDKHRGHISSLIYPRMTVMDLNIGTAIWFAVRGSGRMIAQSHFGEKSAISNKLVRLGKSGQPHGELNTADGGEPSTSSDDDRFAPLIDALVREGFDSNGPDGGNILFSTLGKDYSDVLTPVYLAAGHKKLGPYIDAAEKAGIVKIGSNHRTGKYVRLLRERDIALATEAAKATQHLKSGGTEYKRKGRVVILGMGADETLGGYVRHYRLFQREGADGLKREMLRDFTRLWQRNLGRDDRIVSDHGVEGRFPFLDEEVLETLSLIPIDGVCDMRQSGGDKLVLRTAARMLGLVTTSALQKRAIQFGTRIANRKIQGSTPLAACNPEVDLQNPRVVRHQ